MTRLEAWLDEDPARLDQRDEDGRTPVARLAHALTGEQSIPLAPGPETDEALLQRILARGADPDIGTEDGWTPLHTAAMSGHTRLAKILLDAGASVHVHTKESPDATPLCWALFYAQIETAELLAAHETAPEGLRTDAALGRPLDRWFDADGNLQPGAMGGRGFYRPSDGFPVWEPILDRQTTLDESLSWAARNNRVDAMAALVGRGANVNANPYRGTPLLWATYAAQHDAIRWLVDQGADVNLQHDFGGADHGKGATALHLAAQFGALDTIHLLLDLGADRMLRDGNFEGIPAEWAYHCEQPEAVQLLLPQKD